MGLDVCSASDDDEINQSVILSREEGGWGEGCEDSVPNALCLAASDEKG